MKLKRRYIKRIRKIDSYRNSLEKHKKEYFRVLKTMRFDGYLGILIMWVFVIIIVFSPIIQNPAYYYKHDLEYFVWGLLYISISLTAFIIMNIQIFYIGPRRPFTIENNRIVFGPFDLTETIKNSYMHIVEKDSIKYISFTTGRDDKKPNFMIPVDYFDDPQLVWMLLKKYVKGWNGEL